MFTSPARQGFGADARAELRLGRRQRPVRPGLEPGGRRRSRARRPRACRATTTRSDSDVFILSGAEDLVPLLVESGGSWAPADSSGPSARAPTSCAATGRGWRAASRGSSAGRTRRPATCTGGRSPGRTSRASTGRTRSSRIADPEDPARVFSWLLDLSYDDRGNAISYVLQGRGRQRRRRRARERGRTAWSARTATSSGSATATTRPTCPGRRLAELPTQWCFELVLDYGEHDLNDADARRSERLAVPAGPVLELPLGLRGAHLPDLPAAADVPQLRRARRASRCSCARPTSTYQTSDPPGDPTLPTLQPAHLGHPDRLGAAAAGGGYETEAAAAAASSATARWRSTRPAAPRTRSSRAELRRRVDGTRERWVDLDGEGLQGILTEDDGAWYYKRNVSAWNPAAARPARASSRSRWSRDKPASAARSARRSPTSTATGTCARSSFAPPSPAGSSTTPTAAGHRSGSSQATASVDWASPDLRFVDLDGDGLADVLITEDDAFTWYEWAVGQRLRAGRPGRPSRSTRSAARRSCSPTRPARSSSPT